MTKYELKRRIFLTEDLLSILKQQWEICETPMLKSSILQTEINLEALYVEEKRRDERAKRTSKSKRKTNRTR
jgi:hypothetical protein